MSAIPGELQTWDNDALIACVACVKPDSWFAKMIRTEIKNRGLGHTGRWVGFAASREVWR